MRSTSAFRVALYRVFLVTGAIATAIGLLLIWGFEPDAATGAFLLRVLGTCALLAVASALTLSASRLVAGRADEDGDG